MRIFGEPIYASVWSVDGVASSSGIQPLRPDVLTKDLISACLELPLVAKVHSSIGKAVVMTYWLLLFPISSLSPRPRLHLPRLSLGPLASGTILLPAHMRLTPTLGESPESERFVTPFRNFVCRRV